MTVAEILIKEHAQSVTFLASFSFEAMTKATVNSFDDSLAKIM